LLRKVAKVPISSRILKDRAKNAVGRKIIGTAYDDLDP